jgi:ribonuclease Z
MAKSCGEYTVEVASSSSSPIPASASATRSKAKHHIEIEGYPVDGVSIGGQETCVIFPTLSLAFDIGRCPQCAVSQEFLFVSYGHLDHIGGLPMYVASGGSSGCVRPPSSSRRASGTSWSGYLRV